MKDPAFSLENSKIFGETPIRGRILSFGMNHRGAAKVHGKSQERRLSEMSGPCWRLLNLQRMEGAPGGRDAAAHERVWFLKGPRLTSHTHQYRVGVVED